MSFSSLCLIVSLILAGAATVGVSWPRFSALAGAFFFFILSLVVGSGVVTLN